VRAGAFRSDKFSLFLCNYNETCKRLPIISPLTEREQKYLAPMISIANLYLLNWEMIDFFKPPRADDGEHYKFIKHNIDVLNWLVDNEAELGLWIKKSSY
jgi:hypothetical protein